MSGHGGRRRDRVGDAVWWWLVPVAGAGRVGVAGTIIEFYTQLEINKGGELDDRLKDTRAGTPVATPAETVLKHSQRLLDPEPVHHTRRGAPSPGTPAPYHTTSDYLQLAW